MALPTAITHQDKLLTINTNEETWIKSVLVHRGGAYSAR